MWGELKQEDKYFKPALEKGAQMVRHNNTPENARAILRHLIERTPLPFRIQTELVDEQKTMPQTAAGEELDCLLLEQMRKHEVEMSKLMEDMQDALRQKDEEHREELEAEKQALQELIDRIGHEQKTLATEYAKQKAELEEQKREALAKEEELCQQIQVLRNNATSEKESLERELQGLRQQLSELRNRPAAGCSIM
ncbi:hypothetical protein MPER_04540 [Moniliophthora perniciosa FA553]|nr:hypothetical protein MPER_04540 [Moniliophthora perniciosa FA553]